ncbi:MAG: glycosyltransferase family 4 protein [Bacillota bacterium]
MRVLMLSWEYPPRSVGGLARHVEDLSLAEAAQGHQVHVVTCGTPGAPPYEEELGVHVHRVDLYPVDAPDLRTWVLQLNVKMMEQAVSLVERFGKFGVIHAHDWLAAFAGRALKHAFQWPLIATIHATEAGRNHGLHNDSQRYISSVEWWLTYEAWRVIVCSWAMFQEVQNLFQLPSDKIRVIPNGVNAAKFQNSEEIQGFRERFAVPGEKIIFFVGRLVQEKGVQVVLDAMPAILASCPEAKLIIAGTGPMENHLRHRAWSLNIATKVHFTGYIDDQTRNQLYRNASVAVFPSLYEPFGIVALEAMAAETPAVVSDTGGLSEIITHGINGLKAHPGNADSLASNIVRVLRDGGYAGTLRQNASRLVQDVYDWRQIARQTIEVYHQVLNDHRRSRWAENRPAQRFWQYALSLVALQNPRQWNQEMEEGIDEVRDIPRHSLVDQRVTAYRPQGGRKQ